MKSNLIKFLTVGSLVTGGLVIANTEAEAFVIGNSFTASGNVYVTSTQFDFTGPNPVPVAPSLNTDGFFTITASPGSGFNNGIFNTAQAPTPSGFIKDIRDASMGDDGPGGTVIDQAGPVINLLTPNNIVTDFITFNNTVTGVAGTLNFGIDLHTLTRSANGGGPVLPTTLISSLVFEATGKLVDKTTGDVFDVIGSLTPNIGSGSSLAGTTFGQLNATDFKGSIGYTMDWTIVPPQGVPESSPVSALIGFGLVGSAFALRRKVKVS